MVDSRSHEKRHDLGKNAKVMYLSAGLEPSYLDCQSVGSDAGVEMASVIRT